MAFLLIHEVFGKKLTNRFPLHIQRYYHHAQWIRQSGNIKGNTINGEQHKIALYADVLIYVSEPANSVSGLFELLDTFGKYAGYNLNVQKTQILTQNYTPSKQLWDKFHL